MCVRRSSPQSLELVTRNLPGPPRPTPRGSWTLTVVLTHEGAAAHVLHVRLPRRREGRRDAAGRSLRRRTQCVDAAVSVRSRAPATGVAAILRLWL